jgi:hypothetical protein
MGMRQRGYWIRQVTALRNQEIAQTAYAVSLGMATDKDERQKAIDELELSDTAEANKKKRSQAVWDLMRVFGGGKGV